jgi:hypothetical protein
VSAANQNIWELNNFSVRFHLVCSYSQETTTVLAAKSTTRTGPVNMFLVDKQSNAHSTSNFITLQLPSTMIESFLSASAKVGWSAPTSQVCRPALAMFSQALPQLPGKQVQVPVW